MSRPASPSHRLTDVSRTGTATLRIVVRHPLPHVELRLQRGRDELVPPVATVPLLDGWSGVARDA